MGYSEYSHVSYAATARSFSDKSKDEIFSHKIHQTMDPKQMSLRECRDSENHPKSLPIIIGLDVTGSMGYIPENMIKGGLGTIMHDVINNGIADPAICFVAIGDQFSDDAPIQVGQFESGDQDLVKWLQNTWLEGHGGGTAEESYQMAWYFALNNVETDHWTKRKQKGLIITIGDEAVHQTLDRVPQHFGKKQSDSMSTKELLDKIIEKWDVYHIHANDGSYPYEHTSGKNIVDSWRNLLGQKVFVVENHNDIPKKIVDIINEHEKNVGGVTFTEEEIEGKTDTDISGGKKML